jgi:hypothetical protein
VVTEAEQALLDEFATAKKYIDKLHYLRFNLAHAHESKYFPPDIFEKMMAQGLKDLRKEMEEKGIKIPGYNI